MQTDTYGRQIYTQDELCDILLRHPGRSLDGVYVNRAVHFDPQLDIETIPQLLEYSELDCSVEDFDRELQSRWHMPHKYQNIDLVEYLITKCVNQDQIQRVAEELLLYMERDAFPLLRYLIYLVDVMRERGILWGVGRGSSVCSYVLYLIGVHRIDSMYYDLDIGDFLK